MIFFTQMMKSNMADHNCQMDTAWMMSIVPLTCWPQTENGPMMGKPLRLLAALSKTVILFLIILKMASSPLAMNATENLQRRIY